MKVLVLWGGDSPERTISERSTSAILGPLRQLGHEVRVHEAFVPEIVDVLRTDPPDVVFNACHGGPGENGTVRGVLDCFRVKATHSGFRASVIAMHKPTASRLVRSAGVPCPREFVYVPGADEMSTQLVCPAIVKPLAGGSSIGLLRFEEPLRLKSFLSTRRSPVLVQEYVAGREITVALMGSDVLAVAEIEVASSDVFDFRKKYEAPSGLRILQPASDPHAATAENHSRLVAQLLGLQGLSRVDYRASETGDLYFLEANTQPGLTSKSIAPQLAAAAGVEFGPLLERMLGLAFSETEGL